MDYRIEPGICNRVPPLVHHLEERCPRYYFHQFLYTYRSWQQNSIGKRIDATHNPVVNDGRTKEQRTKNKRIVELSTLSSKLQT
ncbi:MAG TPA: hypothetical protein VFZ66_18300 [Herpetosiphonaceae bacterium]